MHDKMEQIYVSTKAMHGGNVELASLRKKEKTHFLSLSGSGCRRSFLKVFTYIPVENHMQIPMVGVRKLENASRMSY